MVDALNWANTREGGQKPTLELDVPPMSTGDALEWCRRQGAQV